MVSHTNERVFISYFDNKLFAYDCDNVSYAHRKHYILLSKSRGVVSLSQFYILYTNVTVEVTN